ncbi:MAG: flavodoxin family protein [Rhodocyclaceae bacterium]|nr:flavodoxin family protein [Rhodocyclaceae bacterium]
MKTLLIVHHSLTGGTRQMADAAARGAAAESAVATRLLNASAATPEDVLAADGYVFATPENLAAMSGMLKDFFDRSYYACLDRINGRPYGTLVCAGSDGENAARQIARIATGWRLKAVAPPLIVRTHAQTPESILAPKRIDAEDLARCAELGATLAAGLAMGVF